MRAVFGVLSLLVVVAIVGLLARKQLGVMGPTVPVAATVSGTPALSGSPQQQVLQVQQAVQESLQQARPMPDEK